MENRSKNWTSWNVIWAMILSKASISPVKILAFSRLEKAAHIKECGWKFVFAGLISGHMCYTGNASSYSFILLLTLGAGSQSKDIACQNSCRQGFWRPSKSLLFGMRLDFAPEHSPSLPCVSAVIFKAPKKRLAFTHSFGYYPDSHSKTHTRNSHLHSSSPNWYCRKLLLEPKPKPKPNSCLRQN